MPLPDTSVDLWRLVEDFECIAIVMLNELQPEDGVNVYCMPTTIPLLEVVGVYYVTL